MFVRHSERLPWFQRGEAGEAGTERDAGQGRAVHGRARQDTTKEAACRASCSDVDSVSRATFIRRTYGFGRVPGGFHRRKPGDSGGFRGVPKDSDTLKHTHRMPKREAY